MHRKNVSHKKAVALDLKKKIHAKKMSAKCINVKSKILNHRHGQICMLASLQIVLLIFLSRLSKAG